LVLDSAFADFRSMMRLRFRQLSGLPNVFLPGALTALRWTKGTDLRSLCPADDAAKLPRRPVLVIHAEGDPFVPVDDAQVLAAAAGAELWVTPGEHHLASFRHAPQAYVAKVAGFFNQHLAGQTPLHPAQPLSAVPGLSLGLVPTLTLHSATSSCRANRT